MDQDMKIYVLLALITAASLLVAFSTHAPH
jgi:hypothetical protein